MGLQLRQLIKMYVQRVAVVTLAFLLPFSYTYAIELTRPSPLVDASPSQHAILILHILGLSIVLGAVFAAVALLADLLITSVRPKFQWLATRLIVALIIFLTMIMVVENFSYTMFGMGLKTDDGILLKIAFMFIASVVAIPVSGLLLRARSGARFFGVVAPLVVAAYLIVPSGVSGATSDLGNTSQTKQGNVLILSSDSITADRMSVYGAQTDTTPFLRSISPELRIFSNAYTNNGHTTGSITSMLTGRSPLTTGVVYPPDILRDEDSLLNVPRLLGLRGYYRSNWAVPYFADAVEQNIGEAFDRSNGTYVSADLYSLLPREHGLTAWFTRRTASQIESLARDVFFVREADNPFDQIEGAGGSLSDRQRLKGAIAEIESHDRFFIHVHFMGSHGPLYRPIERRFSAGMQRSEPFQKEFYDDALLDFDDEIKLFYESLKSSGKLDNTLLIITSDHPMRFETDKRIPILIRYPHAADAGVVRANVQRLDIAPTVLDFLGIPVPPWVESKTTLNGPVAPDRLILAPSIVGTKIDSKGRRVHIGGSKLGPNHRLAAIKCDRVFRFAIPLKLLSTSLVEGNTSPCSSSPDDEPAIAAAISKLLQ